MTEPELPDWARAHGEPLCAAVIRSSPEDFLVDEVLGFEPVGVGEHDLLQIEKKAANTGWVAGRLARHAGVRQVDVGFAGLKDRNAVTRQWFSVRRPNRDGTDWDRFEAEGVRILRVSRHDRKLRRGSHTANHFCIRLRGQGFRALEPVLRARCNAIASKGVPNYFGPQRFGRGGGNIRLATRCFDGERMRRDKRSIAISTARSLIFNAILDRRVAEDSWNRLCVGDIANLDGTNSVFAVDGVTSELEGRCAELDVHPTGTLWGEDAPLPGEDIEVLERDIAGGFADLADGLAKQRIKAASRPLRARVEDITLEIAEDVVRIDFSLRPGAYATSVLREICEAREA